MNLWLMKTNKTGNLLPNQPLFQWTFGELQSQYNPNPSQFDSDLVPNCFCTLFTLAIETGHMSLPGIQLCSSFVHLGMASRLEKCNRTTYCHGIVYSKIKTENAINLKTCVKFSMSTLNDNFLTVNRQNLMEIYLFSSKKYLLFINQIIKLVNSATLFNFFRNRN